MSIQPHDYNEDLMRRLKMIREMGESSQPRRMQPQQNRQSQPTAPVGRGDGSFDSFMRAISAQESGGNYGAMGINVRGDRAHGKYQIMGRNIPSWSRAALGRSVSAQEFLRNPEIQEAVARHQLSQYYNKYGAAGAAVAWYSGEGNARKYLRSGGQGYGRRQNGGRFPSIDQYVQAILRRMG